MKDIFKYHFLAIFCALILSFTFCFFVLKLDFFTPENSLEIKKIIGRKTSLRGLNENLKTNELCELELLGSLKDKKGITLFGSSELSNYSATIPYIFLPDSLSIRVNAFGHAFQQNLSIYTQLLAFKSELKNSKICIMISPGWFETDGTNIEAFLEFVRPNFLQKIIHDNRVSPEEKMYIGKYLNQNFNLIANPTPAIKYFVNLYRYRNIPYIKDYFHYKKQNIQNIAYHLIQNSNSKKNSSNFNWNQLIKEKSNEFKKSVHSNNLYIIDSYFKSEVLKKDGTIRKGHFDQLDIASNEEWKDFKQLIRLIKEQKCKATFVIQALNPYHFMELENFNPILTKMITIFKKEKIPYLNQFTSYKRNYLPGTLNDIMHTSDVGWLQINKFLVKAYEN